MLKRDNKIYFFFFLLPVALQAVCAKYDVRFSLFGTIGEVDACFTQNAAEYSLSVEGRTVGLAKMVSADRREMFFSSGHLQNSRFVPRMFIKRMQRKGVERWTLYRFDHANKQLVGESIRQEAFVRQTFDAATMSLKKVDDERFEVVSFSLSYVGNDLLSLYLTIDTRSLIRSKRLASPCGILWCRL